jgi:hypothetical protein
VDEKLSGRSAPTKPVETTPPPPPAPTKPVEISAFYKRLVVWVFIVAVGCLLLEIVLGFSWPVPTTSQQKAADALDFGWKAGFGVVIGLLAGKQF